MVQKNQGMKKKDLLENVRKQVQINLIQQRKNGIGAGIGFLVYILFVTVLVVGSFYTSEEQYYYPVIYGYGSFSWIGILCILVSAYQMFTNEAISMYPGNAITRYLGRVIVDHIWIVYYILCVGMAYILQSGLSWILLRGITDLDITVIFDIRYLGVGLLRFGAYAMALYGVFALVLALDARFGIRFRIGLLAGILVLVFCGVRYRLRFMVSAWRWIRGDHTELFPYIGIFLLIWLLCILAAGILAGSIRYWRMGYYTGNAVFLGVAFLGVIVFAMIFLTNVTITIESGDEEEIAMETSDGEGSAAESGNEEEIGVTQYREEDLYSSILIKLPEDYNYSMDEDMVDVVDANGKRLCGLYEYMNENNNMGFDVWGKSEAAEIGIPKEIDLSGIDEEHGMLIFNLQNVRINGQEIYRDLVEDMQKNLRQTEDRSKIKLEYAGNLKSTLCFDFFPSADRFLYHDSGDMTMKEYTTRPPYSLTTLLLSDAQYKAFEKKMEE